MKGYTRKVGMRKALRLRKIEWLNQAIRETTDPVMRSVWRCELYLLTGPYWHRGGFKGVAYDNGGLLEPITQTFNAYAAEPVLTSDRNRTRGRVVKPAPVVASDEFARNWYTPLPPDDGPLAALVERQEQKRRAEALASCPHCACYMHAECCYCDGRQVHK